MHLLFVLNLDALSPNHLNPMNPAIDKPLLVRELIQRMQADLQQARQAAEQAHAGATHEQSKAETQYDTLGLEHAYLAEGQSRRIESLVQGMLRLEHMGLPTLSDDDAIVLGAVIDVRQLSASPHPDQTLFLASAGGGYQIPFGESLITVITPQSPLGEELLGRYLFDEFKWPNGTDGEITGLV